jgi:hypothetical protein
LVNTNPIQKGSLAHIETPNSRNRQFNPITISPSPQNPQNFQNVQNGPLQQLPSGQK